MVVATGTRKMKIFRNWRATSFCRDALKAREEAIPPPGTIRLTEALERLVQLYTDWHAAEPDKDHDAKAAE
jgi:hypothetical protein